ncbi:TrbG/VirB9 family P-type conjugative transfer protein [Neisseria sp. Ec49-e6-T10]|uniref:TrbG/VirB9 family P-type conjugative transfer protein n=1 Tax=Neisseria sp. Ec49-e6-T10 TaxID=3140744 RepID=UPI003EBFDA36
MSVKKYFGIFSILFSVLALKAYAAPVKEYFYEEGKIYPIHTGAGIATQIEISPKEEVKDFGTGFSSAWDLARRENVFYLKPRDLDADTNMYIRTNKHVYLFDLKVISKDWKKLEQAKSAGVNYRIVFTYPPEAIAVGKTAEGAQQGNSSTSASTSITGFTEYNMKYDYSAGESSAWLKPVKVYDDNYFTYIHMPKLTSSPAVYGRKNKGKGSEYVLNTTVEGNVIIVHGTHPYLILRHGDSVVGLRRNK